MTLFEGLGQDPYFQTLRGREDLSCSREALEDLWVKFQPYAEPAFKAELSKNFQGRYWEMYLANVLLHTGRELCVRECQSQDGPDLCVADKGKRVWIEAVAPERGTTEDAVPKLEASDYIAEDRIILRLTGAISKKKEQLSRHVAGGAVSTSEACIIAVNGWLIPGSGTGLQIPYIVKAVLPIGHRRYRFGGEPLRRLDAAYELRRELLNSKGATIPTDTFLHREYAIVSGVLFSRASAFVPHASFGSDFVFVHNPNADSPLPRGWLGVGHEFWVDEDEELRSTAWSG